MGNTLIDPYQTFVVLRSKTEPAACYSYVRRNGVKNPFCEKWEPSSDSEWLSTLIKSINSGTLGGVDFPKWPSAETQGQVHGSFSPEIAIRGAFRFYVEARLAAAKSNLPFNSTRTFLDLGTGWGRIIHPFMREFDLERIHGAEPDRMLFQQAQQLNRHVKFIHSDYQPPLPVAASSVSYVTAYSIFTHLPESLFLSWFQEFHRILSPGGLVLFTVLGKRLISELQAESKMDATKVDFWHKILIDHLPDFEKALRELSKGRLLFLRTHDNDSYGDTFMSLPYIDRQLRGKFEVTHTNLENMAQDFVCVRKI